MTVQELMDALNKVEDKSKNIVWALKSMIFGIYKRVVSRFTYIKK